MIRIGATFLALLALSATTFLLSGVALGALEAPVALGIASAKAGLVALVFMRLGEEPASSRLAAAVAVGMVVLLVGFAVADVVSR